MLKKNNKTREPPSNYSLQTDDSDTHTISLLVLVLLYVTAEPQQPHQCTDPSKPRSFIRDSPLHEALVADTGKALDKFVDSSGSGRYRPRYFEGWYYKIDLPSDGGTFVVIPGLYLRKEEQHGFVRVLLLIAPVQPISLSIAHHCCS